jgi:hypothetical protein
MDVKNEWLQTMVAPGVSIKHAPSPTAIAVLIGILKSDTVVGRCRGLTFRFICGYRSADPPGTIGEDRRRRRQPEVERSSVSLDLRSAGASSRKGAAINLCASGSTTSSSRQT